MVAWNIKQLRDPHNLERLQRVQEDIYAQLQCLVPDGEPGVSHWRSQVPGGMPLHVQLLERHPYTSFLRLTHHFEYKDHLESEPEAHVRCYHDLNIAEVTAFDTLQGIRRMAHPSMPARGLWQLAWRNNRSLEKWLQYLLDQGHCRDTMQAQSRNDETQTARQVKSLTMV